MDVILTLDLGVEETKNELYQVQSRGKMNVIYLILEDATLKGSRSRFLLFTVSQKVYFTFNCRGKN